MSAVLIPGRFPASDSIDEAVDHPSLEDNVVTYNYTIDELIARSRQLYKNLLQTCVGHSLEVCADKVAAHSCVVFELFGYTFVIHKIPCSRKEEV